MGQLIAPDFIQIPRELLIDQALTPLDRILYGYIYWFSKLKNEKCTASNETLAELCGVTNPQVITNGLNRLEIQGYITRLYNDTNRRKRSEIIPLVYYAKVKSITLDNVTITSDNVIPITSTNVENKNNINKNNKREITHAGKFSFFTDPKEQEEIKLWLITDKGLTEELANELMEAFILYWTEPNARGVPRYQKETYFQIKGRFGPWLRRGDFKPEKSRKLVII